MNQHRCKTCGHLWWATSAVVCTKCASPHIYMRIVTAKAPESKSEPVDRNRLQS